MGELIQEAAKCRYQEHSHTNVLFLLMQSQGRGCPVCFYISGLGGFREEGFHLWEFLESRHTEFGVEHIQPCEVTLDLFGHSGFKGAKLELSLETGSEKQTFMKAACQEEKHGEVQLINRALFSSFLLSPTPHPFHRAMSGEQEISYSLLCSQNWWKVNNMGMHGCVGECALD